MRKVSFIFLSFLILSCQKEEEIDLSNINLLSVSFQRASNPSLNSNIKLDFDNEETTISGATSLEFVREEAT